MEWKRHLTVVAAFAASGAPAALHAQQSPFDRCMSGAAARERSDLSNCNRAIGRARADCVTRISESAQRARNRCVETEQSAQRTQREREREAQERARLRGRR
jgi:hypothetical protein